MPPLPRALLRSTRGFSTSASSLAGQTGPCTSRAVVFAAHGDPKQVLKVHTYQLPALEKGGVRLRYELSAVNPADINVIQGVYPAKPVVRKDIGEEPLSIMGNEGVGIVEGFLEDGEVEKVLKVGDRVAMGRAQLGTWQSYTNLPLAALIPLSSHPLTPTQAATLSINPPTALRMLSDFVPLNPAHPKSLTREKGAKKQWVIQNGGNSAVGMAVCQIAKEWGVGVICLVRDRPDLSALTTHLTSLGATHVLTYSSLLSNPRESRAQIKSWTAGGSLRLALNCVGGAETTEMCKLLDSEGVLVTYGGMAKEALKVPPGLFIFKKLTATGFWLSNWVETHPEERKAMMDQLAQLVAEGKLVEPPTQIVDLEGDDAVVGETVREVMRKMEEGRGKKVLLRFV